LKRYGVVTDLVLYPREPHGFQEAKHRVDVQKRMVAWLEKYVKEVGRRRWSAASEERARGQPGCFAQSVKAKKRWS